MKSWLILILATVGLLPEWSPTVRAADTDEENKLIQVLQSAALPAEKDAACARLKFIGTSRCVPALAALLTDQQLSHSARYALEPMRLPEAGSALTEALGKTKGLTREGIINSLAARQEAKAVPALVELLRDPDAGTETASARALGEIGGPDALKALRTCARNWPAPRHGVAVDALLRCANRLLAAGQRSDALAIFEQLDAASENDFLRVAAFTGRVRSSGNDGLSLVLHALSGPDGPTQMAALQLARDLQAPNATEELAGLVPTLRPLVQIALIGALAQRGDTAALPALRSLGNHARPELHRALIQAFDALGDSSVVSLLTAFAASGPVDEQAAARRALADLHRGDITQALIEELSSASPQVQAELARALGARGDKAAVPKLLDLAQRGPDSARKGALQALSVLADDSQLGALVDLVVRAKEPAQRAEATETLNSAYQHILSERGHADAAPLVAGVQKGSSDARAALLPVGAGLVDPNLRAALRIALHDQEPQVHAAAIRAICDTIDPELLGDLIQLAQLTRQESVRTLAINGVVRLVTQEDSVKLAPNRRVAALKPLLACAARPEEKRKVLAGLAEVPDLQALEVVGGELDDDAVRNEAARAAVKIATALAGQTQATEPILRRALAAVTDAGTRLAVQAALEESQNNGDYLTTWEVAGPYHQAGKDYAALFDIVFPPETKSATGVKWQSLPAGADPSRPYVMDLLKALGGQECVAYARTWIHSDNEHQAQFELGSDDGVKVWINHQPVYALNAARPLQPGSDKFKVTLHRGWNPLLLKITQNSQGWEFCVRVRKADGTHLEGIQCALAPNSDSAGP